MTVDRGLCRRGVMAREREDDAAEGRKTGEGIPH